MCARARRLHHEQSTEMSRLTINGTTCEVPEGVTILDALRVAGVEVPRACDDPRLTPFGGCRLCTVKVDGPPHYAAACTAAAADGMVIDTHAPDVEALRRELLRMMARDYPPDAVREFPELEFHRYLRAYGLLDELREQPGRAVDDSHPYIRVDMTQCISCFRCVRICDDLQGQFVWSAHERGGRTRIVPDSGGLFGESSCVSCGACADTCPTGAILDKTVAAHAAATTWTRTTCPYCGVGCEMHAGTRDGRLVEIRPVLDAPVSKGHLCVKGRYAFDFVHAPDRITTPMIRNGMEAEWREVGWEDAIAFAAERLRAIVAAYGSDAVGVLGSARATNEENYLAQKFARIVLGTNNVDCCARVCHGPTAVAMNMMLGTGAATNSLDDIERARTIQIGRASCRE